MTDDDLTDAQTEAVRRLLADVRETGPMPTEVAARLDAVVADLAGTTATDHAAASDAPAAGASTDDSPASGAPATVIPLHRRRWTRVVLAAAAVTAIGLGGTQLLVRSAQDDMQADSASEVADAPTLQRDEGAGEDARSGLSGDVPADDDRRTGSLTDKQDELESYAGGGTARRPTAVSLPGLDQALVAQELPTVGRLREIRPAFTRATASMVDGTLPLDAARQDTRWRCGPLYAVPGGSTYASLSVVGALVVAHPPANGIRLVEVYHCRGAEPRRSTTVVTLTVQE